MLLAKLTIDNLTLFLKRELLTISANFSVFIHEKIYTLLFVYYVGGSCGGESPI